MSSLNSEKLISILDKMSSFKSAIFLVLTGITRQVIMIMINEISVHTKIKKHNKTNDIS